MTSGKYGESNAVDLSDWGRYFAKILAKNLKNTPISVIQVTNIHLLISIFCSWLIIQGYTIESCFLLIIKGVIDAVDGELARLRERPSHVGRYWDTIADTIGLISVMFAFGIFLDWNSIFTFFMILAILFQYSLFNHFSIMMRRLGTGDSTSRLDERSTPMAHEWEKQRNVNFLHFIYVIFFSWQDSIISKLTGRGSKSLVFELTVSSLLGYGVQSIFIFSLALMGALQHLPKLVFGLNGIIMIIIILRSRLVKKSNF
jgi:phosphatidylglycerophosphate synthase